MVEAAGRLAVSPRRVRQLLEDGKLRGRRISGRWVIDLADLRREAPVARPMSSRNAWGLIDVLDGRRPAGLESFEVSRLRRKARRLRDHPEPARLLRAWLSARAQRLELHGSAKAMERLRDDRRVVLSGMSDPRSGLSAARQVEGYVAADDMWSLRRDLLLVDQGEVNVVLHVVDRELPLPVPAALVAADLVQVGGPREDAAARRLIRESA